MKEGAILYISSILPARSETFVYREIFALRALGVAVLTASVHKPEKNLGTSELETLATAAIPVYGAGGVKIVLDALKEGFNNPFRTLKVYTLAIRDLVFGKDIHGKKRLKILVQAMAAMALVKRVRPLGVIHIHAHMAHVPTTIAMYAARQLGIQFSFTGHANDLFPNRALLKEKIERSLFISCISHWHRDFYLSFYPKAPNKLPIIRCGVDTEKEIIKPIKREENLRILSVGRLVPKKGFDLLIEAVSRIARKGKVNIELTLAGSGPEEEALRRQASGLPSSVNFIMLGSVDNALVLELMTNCDLFVLPLRVSPEGDRDGIPVVLMEAMARGRCVISGDLQTIRELIEDGVSGFLVKLGDVAVLENIIEELSAEPERRERTGRKGRERIIAEFDVTKNALELLRTMRNTGINVQRPYIFYEKTK